MSSKPTLPVLKDINHLFYKYIWQDKPDKIKRDMLQQPFIGRGLGMVNIEQFLKSLKLTWLRRTINILRKVFLGNYQIIKKSPFLWAFGSNHLKTHKLIRNILPTDKTSPRFYHGQTSAAFPRHLNSSRCPHCSVQLVLMMSSRTSS